MASACIEMQQDSISPSYGHMQEVVRLLTIRKDASAALKRQRGLCLARSPMKSIKQAPKKSENLKSPVRVNIDHTDSDGQASMYSSMITSRSSSNTESSLTPTVQLDLQVTPSITRTRPAYASASKTATVAALDCFRPCISGYNICC